MLDLPERPPIATAPISAVLLVHQATAEVEKTIGGWAAQLESRRQDYELLVADAGVSGPMAELGEALAQRYPRLRFLGRPAPAGLGRALRAGLEAARHPLLLYTLCDCHYLPSDLSRFFQSIDKVDLVSGYRRRRLPLREWFADYPSRRLCRLLFGIRLRDIRCWFVLARRSIFRRIPIQSDGAFAHVEILAKANYLGYWMDEAPVHYRPDAGVDPRATRALRRPALAQARRVFFHPDFGPARLPDQEPGQ